MARWRNRRRIPSYRTSCRAPDDDFSRKSKTYASGKRREFKYRRDCRSILQTGKDDVAGFVGIRVVDWFASEFLRIRLPMMPHFWPREETMMYFDGTVHLLNITVFLVAVLFFFLVAFFLLTLFRELGFVDAFDFVTGICKRTFSDQLLRFWRLTGF